MSIMNNLNKSWLASVEVPRSVVVNGFSVDFFEYDQKGMLKGFDLIFHEVEIDNEHYIAKFSRNLDENSKLVWNIEWSDFYKTDLEYLIHRHFVDYVDYFEIAKGDFSLTGLDAVIDNIFILLKVVYFLTLAKDGDVGMLYGVNGDGDVDEVVYLNKIEFEFLYGDQWILSGNYQKSLEYYLNNSIHSEFEGCLIVDDLDFVCYGDQRDLLLGICTNINKEVALRLKLTRLWYGYSQDDVILELKQRFAIYITRSTLARYENGDRLPSSQILNALFSILRIGFNNFNYHANTRRGLLAEIEEVI